MSVQANQFKTSPSVLNIFPAALPPFTRVNYFIGHEIKARLRSRELPLNRTRVFARERARQSSSFLAKDESWFQPVTEETRIFKPDFSLFFSLSHEITFTPVVLRFSRSKVARLSAGGGIHGWQRTRERTEGWKGSGRKTRQPCLRAHYSCPIDRRPLRG